PHLPSFPARRSSDLEQHKLDAAAEYGRRAASAAPDSPVAHARWGRALYLRGDIDHAVAVLQRAVEVGPSADAWFHLGLIWAEERSEEHTSELQSLTN